MDPTLTLLAAENAAPGGAGVLLSLAAGIGVVIYAVKRKGKQWPDIAIGVFLAVVIGAAFPDIFTSLGSAWTGLIGSIGDSISGLQV